MQIYKALKAPVAVLQDEEVEMLYDKTNWQSKFETQRMNILILSFQLGQRPSNIWSLKVGNVQSFLDNPVDLGDPVLEVAFPQMKTSPHMPS